MSQQMLSPKKKERKKPTLVSPDIGLTLIRLEKFGKPQGQTGTRSQASQTEF